MTRPRPGRFAGVFAAVLLAAPVPARAEGNGRHQLTGLVLEVAPGRERVVVSHDSIPDVMDAMTMAFDVRDPGELAGVEPGTRIAFTLVLGEGTAHAEAVRVLRDENPQQDPQTARRLRLLGSLIDGGADARLTPGQAVPDFRLIDQRHRPVALSQFRGRVVAVNFIYTSCALPEFCFRVANQFGALQGRFEQALGRDLVLLTITFDPARDRPEVLSDYARRTLKASSDGWRFLTGSAADVREVCRMFGVDAFPDEGLMNHSTRTVVIDRRGVLAASIEGNALSARQLGDLIDTVLRTPR